MALQNLEEAHLPVFFRKISQELSTTKILPITGFSHLTAQTYFMVNNPAIKDRVLFWFVTSAELSDIHSLLTFWHKINKIVRPVWQLDEITPFRASRLTKMRSQIILVDSATFLKKIPSLDNIKEHELLIVPEQRVSPSELSQELIRFGYEFSGHATQSGYFARRGGVLDIYPIGAEQPIRIEFQGTTVNSLQTFNPVNKRTTGTIKLCTVIAKKFSKSNSRTSITNYLSKIHNPLVIYHDTDELRSQSQDWNKALTTIKPYEKIVFQDFSKEATSLSFESAPVYRGNFSKFIAELKSLQKKKWDIQIATNKPRELKQLFKEKNVQTKSIVLLPYEHALHGFKHENASLLFLTDREIFGEENIRDISPRKRVDQAFVMGLRAGDYVVHLDHGIGRFVKMTENTVEGIVKEYFVLQYAEGDKLYVPVETADKISKYIGIANPKLHRLSGGQWYQLTRKVKQEAKVLAQELLKIYAKREMVKVKPFSKDTREEKELVESFPYQETPHQAEAIADVKNDLERETPMDRLICGDVGFGKTEVAVRAALKAVMNKKQVALLAPTTILTQQHFDTFCARLKKLPVKIGILSRFESDKEQQDTIEKMKGGVIDIVIGTHRLLSQDVNFKNLGLIIIDEEQRFGVKAKERLKGLRTQIHILTLTATPIPRTLNIALSGVRDVSIIETPPEGRLPIETKIELYEDSTVQKVSNAELRRKGQIYYLHNKVETIDFAAKQLQELIPKAKIGIAHGRLPEKNLAQAMADFDNKKTNMLVCSTIIENGLDLPNVNTLIVDNATNFGLAQLYQLRGRIGRGERQAYAYFLYHRKNLKGNAKKRLQALLEAKKLGSGFQLALRDLEIRGAGNILGKEQHGKVSAIGLSLYTRLLAQAIEELKFGKVQEPIRDILIDLPLEAYIPKEFLPEEERLLLYQKMAGVLNLDELQELKDKMIRSRSREEQRHFPEQVLNLFEILQVRLLAQKTDLSHIDTTLIRDEFGHKKRRLIIKFLFPIKPEPLSKLLQKNNNWQFNDDSIKIDLEHLGDNWLDELKSVIRSFENKEQNKK